MVTAPDGLIGARVGDYEIVGLLGAGGMGTVYEGRHPVIGKRVAIKVLAAKASGHPDVVQRFVNEARAVNAIRHRGIVDIFAFGQLDDGRHYLVMEHLEGLGFDRIVLERAPVPVGSALAWTTEIVEALGAAHQSGIIHRDLKPSNLWLVERPGQRSHVKVLDFGIAKIQGPLDASVPLTSELVILGTPSYMAPEQVLGRPVSAASDFYALGCVLFELLTGRRPFISDTPLRLLWMHVEEPLPDVSALNPALPASVAELVCELLAKNPSDRPASAEALLLRLSGLARTGEDAGVNRVAGSTGSAARRSAGRAVAVTHGSVERAPATLGAREPQPGAQGVQRSRRARPQLASPLSEPAPPHPRDPAPRRRLRPLWLMAGVGLVTAAGGGALLASLRAGDREPPAQSTSEVVRFAPPTATRRDKPLTAEAPPKRAGSTSVALPGSQSPSGQATEREPMLLQVDSPSQLSQQDRSHVFETALVRGWALAGTGVEAVTLAVDGKDLGRIPYGGWREDMGQIYRGGPYRDPSHSDFSVPLVLWQLPAGAHTLEFRARSALGTSRALARDVVVAPASKLIPRDGTGPRLRDTKPRVQGGALHLTRVLWGTRAYDVTVGWDVPSQTFRIRNVEPQAAPLRAEPLPTEAAAAQRQLSLEALLPSSRHDASSGPLALIEPYDGQVYSGIGMVYGWVWLPLDARAVELWVDGGPASTLPTIGPMPATHASGQASRTAESAYFFSMLWAYNVMSAGPHTITVRATEASGRTIEATRRLRTIGFDEPYVTEVDVAWDDAKAERIGERVVLRGLRVKAKRFDVTLVWCPLRRQFVMAELVSP